MPDRLNCLVPNCYMILLWARYSFSTTTASIPGCS